MERVCEAGGGSQGAGEPNNWFLAWFGETEGRKNKVLGQKSVRKLVSMFLCMYRQQACKRNGSKLAKNGVVGPQTRKGAQFVKAGEAGTSEFLSAQLSDHGAKIKHSFS